MNNTFLKKAMPHFIAVFTFLVLSCVYFSPQLKDKQIRQGDIVSYQANAQESLEVAKETGHKPLWTNALFGGMPTYQINTITDGNLINHTKKLLYLFFDRPIGMFIMLMLVFYISMVLFGVNPWISMIGAVAFGLTTNNLVLYEAGHLTKIKSIAFLAPIVVGILLAFREKYLLGTLLFSLGLALNIASNHVQMTYYFFLTLLILGIIQLVDAIKRERLPIFAKATGYLVVGAVLALGTTASNLLPTLEYSRDTMRGKPILEKTTSASDANSSSDVEGLNWEYAMNWSNGGIDLFSSFIPGVAGGGSGEKVKESSPLYKDRNWKQVLSRGGGRAPLYWGALPFTSGPIYFGAVLFFLFVMGLVLVKKKIKWWVLCAVLLTFMLCMGDNMAWFNKPLFDYFPLFNKFRTPNSVLTITSFLIPFFGIFVLSGILKNEYKRDDLLKSLYIGGGALGIICLFFALMGGSFFDFTSPGDVRYTQAGLSGEVLVEARKHLMRSDAWRSFFLIAISGALIWAFAKEKINSTIVIVGIAALTLFDIWGVGRRYVDTEDFVSKRNYAQTFTPTPADEQILKAEKSRGDYRVFDLNNPFNNATPSYFHNTIGGYHPAKLQRYQDLIDQHISKNNQDVLNMLNAKYFVSPDGKVQINPEAAGPVWFVEDIKKVENANAEIDALNNFKPKLTAIVHQEFSDYIDGFNPQKQGSIKLDNYRPDHLTYSSNSTSEQLAVFSEIWYGPDKGWNAYIDGNETEHIRVNYALRALKIPAGQHKIEFKFEPSSYTIGKMISLICSIVLLGGLIGFIYVETKKE